jgi:penicillin-binding protein 1A
MAGPDFIDGTDSTGGSPTRGRSPRRKRNIRRSPFAAWVARSSMVMLWVAVVALIGALIGVLMMYKSYALVRENIDSIVDIELPEGTQATVVYARDYDPKTGTGTELGRIYEYNRQNVDYDDIPPELIACLLSTEDKSFFEHKGVDFPATVRAVARGISRGGEIRGTSTLTQQLARNVFLPVIKSERTLNRKVQEFILAGALEKRFQKYEILESYLNHVYFGAQAYGAKSAASVYFGKPLSKLTLSEAAMLAGMPQAPHLYDPYRNKDAAERCEARRKSVLKLLKARLDSPFFAELKRHDPDKFKDLKITAADIDKALEEKPKLQRQRRAKLLKGEYFVEWLRVKVLKERFGNENYVKNHGLRIVTTIDPKIQAWAEEALRKQIDRDRKAKRVSQGAVIVMEAKTGEVLACVGGYKWRAPNDKGEPDMLNRAMQADRQTGSSFKPFTYATAYEQGFPENLTLYDGPYKPVTQKTGKAWPKNSDHKYRGYIALHGALQHSLNGASVDLMNNCTGIPPVIELASRMGIDRSKLPEVPALTLGVADLTALEQAEAYNTFPNMGTHVESIVIKRIYNQNGMLIENNDTPDMVEQRSNVAFSKDTAWKMVNNMQAVVNAGTGRSARVSGVQIAGKTGTCDDFGDAWFCGYSPEIVCVVWVGNDNFKRKMVGMYGGGAPARTFQDIMAKIYGGNGVSRYKQTKFKQPPGATWRPGRATGGGFGGSGKKKDDKKDAGAEGEGGEKEDQGGGNDNGFYDQWNPPSDGHVFF